MSLVELDFGVRLRSHCLTKSAMTTPMPRKRMPLVLTLLVAAACAPSEVPTSALAPKAAAGNAAVGCWVFVGAGTDSPFLPDGVRLRLEPIVSSRPGDASLDRATFLAGPVSPSSPRHLTLLWSPLVSGDSIYLGIGDGFSVVRSLLKLRGDSLIGSIHSYTDFAAFSRQRRLVAQRVQCPPEATRATA